MKLLSLKCPECGASISIRTGNNYCFCQHCGTRIILVPEDKDRDKERVELIGQLDKLISTHKAIVNKSMTLETYKSALFRLECELEELTSVKRRLLPYSVLAVILAMLILIEVDITTNNDFSFGLLLFMIIITSIGVAGIEISIRSGIKKTKTRIKSQQTLVNRTQSDFNKLYNAADYSLIPSKYRKLKAMEYIHKALCEKRAFDLESAILLYEGYSEKENERI